MKNRYLLICYKVVTFVLAVIAVRLESIGQRLVISSWIVIYICLGFGAKRIEKGFKNVTENA